MYFIYKKQINVASEQNYDVNSIVEWFQELMDQDYIKENYGVDVTASDIVYDIFVILIGGTTTSYNILN